MSEMSTRERSVKFMTNIRNGIRKFWTDESGQSTTEYILILAVVVMIAMKFKKTFEKQMTTLTGRFDSELNKWDE